MNNSGGICLGGLSWRRKRGGRSLRIFQMMVVPEVKCQLCAKGIIGGPLFRDGYSVMV